MSKNSDTSSSEGFTAGDSFFGQMREAGIADDKFIREIVEMFLDEGGLSLDKLKEGLEKNDCNEIQLYAHKLKSSFLMFDMDEAHMLSVNLEKTTADNLAEAATSFERLTLICKRVFELLRQKYIK
jgi:HPt (histidine-containing phosphotransfer) domain-containing protein